MCIHDDNKQNVGEVLFCLLCYAIEVGLAVGCRSSIPFMSSGSIKFRRSCKLAKYGVENLQDSREEHVEMQMPDGEKNFPESTSFNMDTIYPTWIHHHPLQINN